MTEYVYRPLRMRAGKRERSRLFYGRYALERGGRVVTVALDTPDKKVALKRLRDLIVEKQQEAEGLIAPQSIRAAATAPLPSLLKDYAADLRARSTSPYAKESVARIARVLKETGWKRLPDVTPAAWVKWRAAQTCAARTVRAYQTSLVAWLNWLVRMEQLAANPLAKVDAVKIRGKSVRPSRAFTAAEFSALLQAAPWHRRIAYLFLGYTGARKGEARSLQWSDLELGERPCVRFREEKTKSARKRVVPLKPELAQALRDHQGTLREGGALGPLVFPLFPSDDAFHADLRRAGVEKRDTAGRVVHFHAIRKTFQTWGAVAGVGQRSAQEMLGHSDPSLTAGVYTDVAALALHDEVAKLPWLGAAKNGVAVCAQNEAPAAGSDRFRALLGELISLAQVVVSEGVKSKKAGSEEPAKLAARHGFEP